MHEVHDIKLVLRNSKILFMNIAQVCVQIKICVQVDEKGITAL